MNNNNFIIFDYLWLGIYCANYKLQKKKKFKNPMNKIFSYLAMLLFSHRSKIIEPNQIEFETQMEQQQQQQQQPQQKL
ncbi:hypothetical protein DERP_007145 [Dermatophagoides pteronyssinus]|uniref:Uncharacterized protein n=1 Tax=Dermatophagoides pteronyssinus TaxID=6956 RepID=A0ABQ8JUV5_DERPT|nr:hypothetical protein DERP_007145 [Dermatophagoides pteronyssinus]